jgi:hypothetical protein
MNQVKKEKSVLINCDYLNVTNFTANVPVNISDNIIFNFNKAVKLKSITIGSNTAAKLFINGFFVDQDSNDEQSIPVTAGSFLGYTPSFCCSNDQQIFFENLKIFGVRVDKAICNTTVSNVVLNIQFEILEEYIETVY